MRLYDYYHDTLAKLVTAAFILMAFNIAILFVGWLTLLTHVNECELKTIDVEEPIEQVEVIDEEPRKVDISSRELHAVAPRPVVNQEDLEMLAIVIYQEAGGNECCDDCRRRVADVVLNRVNDPRFPNDIRSVLTAPRQYGLLYKTGVVWADRASNPGEKAAVDRAYRIAEEVLLGQHSELYGKGYIWQAEFRQGSEQVEHCGIYFGR